MNEIYDELKEFYRANIIEENFLPQLMLMNSYKDNELIELFECDDEISKGLEIFILRCYNARYELKCLNDGYIDSNGLKYDPDSIVYPIYMYLNDLVKIADYCDKIGILSRAQVIYQYQINIDKYIDVCKSEIFSKDFYSVNNTDNRIYSENKEALVYGHDRIVDKLNNVLNISIDKIVFENDLNKLYLLIVQSTHFIKNNLFNYDMDSIEKCINVLSIYSSFNDDICVSYFNKINRENNYIIGLFKEIIDYANSHPLKYYMFIKK